MELRDRVTIITGAGSGIGRAVAQRFAAEGARRVVCADLNEANAVATAEEIGPVARGVGLDVADEAAVRALVAEVEAADGPIDVFFSNAGYGLPGGLDVPNEEWVRMMDVHFMSHLYAARAVVPSMVARGEGYILSTASAAGLLTQMDSAPYAVTKHAAVAFAEWLAIAYGDRGIRVACLCPQGVRTPMLRAAAETAGGAPHLSADAIEPEAVADAVVAGLADGRFLILPHPQVSEFSARRAGDPDRWLGGMRRLRRRMYAR